MDPNTKLPEHLANSVLSLAERLLLGGACNPADAVDLAAQMHRQAYERCGVTLEPQAPCG